jgi:TPR repeat protein
MQAAAWSLYKDARRDASSLAVTKEVPMARILLPFLLVAATALGGCGYNLSGRTWTSENVIAQADDGDAVAQRIAGDMYYWGDSVPLNWPLAQAYWELAANQGDPVAQQRLDNWFHGLPIHAVNDGSEGRKFFSGGDSASDDESTGEML